jgi:rRNA-processing protein FCF1
MKKVLLDTSFILSCIRHKIDFFEEISLMGIKIIIPNEVISEINRFRYKKTEAGIAVSLLENNKNLFETLELGRGHVDNKIINFVKESPDLMVATLDREIKDNLKQKKNKIMVIRGKKTLEII